VVRFVRRARPGPFRLHLVCERDGRGLLFWAKTGRNFAAPAEESNVRRASSQVTGEEGLSLGDVDSEFFEESGVRSFESWGERVRLEMK